MTSPLEDADNEINEMKMLLYDLRDEIGELMDELDVRWHKINEYLEPGA